MTSSTFPSSNFLILTYTFRFLLWTCKLEYTCNVLRYFITNILTLPHLRRFCAPAHFYAVNLQTRTFASSSDSESFSPLCHSNHACFMDTRHIGNVTHLWTIFVALALRLLSADFSELLTIMLSQYIASRSISGSVSGRYSFIPLLRKSVQVMTCRLFRY